MASQQWDVVVVGGANWDYLVRGPRLPSASETVPGDDFQEAPGGKGANQAVAAARIGARVAFVARIGSDSRGERILEELADEGVNTEFVVRDPVQATGIALVMVDWNGEKQILTAPGANKLLAVTDVERARPIIKSSRVLLTQLEVPVEAVSRAMAIAREGSCRVVLDPAPPVPLSDELLKQVDVIRANAGEAEVLSGIAVQNQFSAARAAAELMKRGVKAAIIQGGGDGNLLLGEDREELWLPKVRLATVDSTGAGDAFAGALAAMLAEGKSLSEAARFANAAAALTTTVVGAQAGLPYRDTVLALLHTQGEWNDAASAAASEVSASDRLLAHASQ